MSQQRSFLDPMNIFNQGSPENTEFSMVPDMSEEDEALEAAMPEAIQSPAFKQRQAIAQTISEDPATAFSSSSPEKQEEIKTEVGTTFISQQVKENPDAQGGSLKGKWLEALTYMAPQLGGALIGGLIGGNKGVAKGYETGTGIRKQFDELDKFNKEFELKKMAQRKLQKSEDMVDSVTGETLSYNPVSGKWLNSLGEEITGDRLKNLRVGREARLERQGDERLAESQLSRNLRERMFGDKQDEDTTKKLTTLTKAIESNAVYKEAEKAVGETATIRALVQDAKSKGGQSLAMLGPRIAKGIAGEVGVLTEQDVTRYLENPAFVPKVADKISKALGGRLTNNSAENILRLLDIMEEKNKAKMDDIIDKKSRVYAGTTKDFTSGQAKKIVSGQSEASELEMKEARRQELRRKKAGK